MKQQTINIEDALSKASTNIDSLDARLLLEFVKGVDGSYLFTHGDEKINIKESKLFFDLVQERKKKKPLAYLVGKKGFWKNDFFVDESVLVPRPETEMLVEKLLEQDLDNKDLLELGIGSGVISLSVAKENKKLNVLGTEKSLSALMIANKNAKSLDVDNVIFINHDWNRKWLFPKMDYIVSNPPYLDRSSLDKDADGVWFEPSIALFSDEKGFKDLDTIISKSIRFLKPKGKLLLEHSYEQSKKIVTLAKKIGYKNLEQLKDNNNLMRVSILSK